MLTTYDYLTTILYDVNMLFRREDFLYENKEELEEYEIKSAKNISYKKAITMEHENKCNLLCI